MDNVKDKKYYLKKVLENLYDIRNFIEGVSLDEFTNNALLQSAVCFKYIQAFESAKNLNQTDFGTEFKDTFIRLRGFRNLIVHEYGKVDLVEVYQTSIFNVPTFIKDVERELK